MVTMYRDTFWQLVACSVGEFSIVHGGLHEVATHSKR